jgi:hypothetical protein
MTQDNIETRRLYRDAYYGTISVAMLELEIIDIALENVGFEGMLYARELMDQKIPLWK